MRSILLVGIILLNIHQAFAGPKEDIDKLVNQIKYEIEEIKSDSWGKEKPEQYSIDRHGEILEEIKENIVRILVIAKQNNLGDYPSTSKLRQFVSEGGSDDSAAKGEAPLRLIEKQRPEGSKGYSPPELNSLLIDIYNAVYYSRGVLRNSDNSHPLDVALRKMLYEMTKNIEDFAYTGHFSLTSDYQRTYHFLVTPPEVVSNNYEEEVKSLAKEIIRDIDGNDKRAVELATVRGKALLSQMMQVFSNPKFQQLPGLEKVFGQKEKKDFRGTTYVPDFSKPSAINQLLRQSYEFMTYNRESPLVGTLADFNFELHAMIEIRGPLQPYHYGLGHTHEEVTKALEFLEPSGQENAAQYYDVRLGREVSTMAHFLSPLFEQRYFPFLLRIAKDETSYQKSKAERILKRFKESNLSRIVVVRLRELAKTKTPTHGYATVDAEARDLFEYIYMSNELGNSDQRKKYFDGINEICESHPEIMQVYLANNKQTSLYVDEIAVQRKNSRILSGSARDGLLAKFFPDPQNKKKVGESFTIQDVKLALQSGLLDIDTLMNLTVYKTNNAELRGQMANLLDEQIVKTVSDPRERKRVNVVFRRRIQVSELEHPYSCSMALGAKVPRSQSP